MNAPNQGPEPDGFERLLARTPLKPAPAEWRAEILTAAGAARDGAPLHTPPSAPIRSDQGPGRSWLEALLRLPLGWAALAAVWLFAISAGNVDRWLNGGSASVWVRVSPAQFASMRIELVEPGTLDGVGNLEPEWPEPRPTKAPREALPRPRSDRRHRGTNDPFDVRFDPPPRLWFA